MGLRLWRRFHIAPGLTLNLSKRGASVSVGRRSAHFTVGTTGVRETVGLPGSGLYYSAGQRFRHHARRHGPNILSGLLGLAMLYAIVRTLLGI